MMEAKNMAEDDTQLIRQVESHLPDLMAIYSDVFQALRKLDRSKYPPDTLQQLDQALEPPTEIEPAKATAILKAILGSTSQDKIHLESFYGAPISGSSSLAHSWTIG